MNLRPMLIGIPVLAVLGGAGWWYANYSEAHPSTSDAYLGRHVVRIAAQVSGPIQSVLVRNNQTVKAGDPLLTIDPAPFELAVRQAEAQLQQAKDSLAAADARVTAAQGQVASAQANASEAERHAERITALAAKGLASKDEGDSARQAELDARAALDSASAELVAAQAARGALGNDNASVKAAQAALDRARLDLGHSRIVAPADGSIGDFDLRPGATPMPEAPCSRSSKARRSGSTPTSRRPTCRASASGRRRPFRSTCCRVGRSPAGSRA